MDQYGTALEGHKSAHYYLRDDRSAWQNMVLCASVNRMWNGFVLHIWKRKKKYMLTCTVSTVCSILHWANLIFYNLSLYVLWKFSVLKTYDSKEDNISIFWDQIPELSDGIWWSEYNIPSCIYVEMMGNRFSNLPENILFQVM